MVVSKHLDVRWIKRYRLFCLGGSVILAIQIFLAYIFLALDSNNDRPTQEYLSGKGRLNVEVLEDHNSVESSRRFRDHDLGQDDDEEDGLGNSNAIYSKLKLPPDKSESFQKSKQVPNKPSIKSNEENKTVLRLEELDFTPMCEIKGKEAISAIHRARSQFCKQTIANVSCLISNNLLYPETLPHLCPAPGLEKAKPMGCYQDDKALRLLTGFYQNLKTTNSPQTCLDLCTQSGFPYAGVQYGSECFCGTTEPPSSAKLPDSSCNMKCPLDPKQPCGGFYTVNIYQTGVSKLPRDNAEITSPPNGIPRARLLYLLTLNGRSIRQVKRLIKTLYHVSHYFYIHVDARQDYLMRNLIEVEKMLPNVRLSRQRAASIWGGASLLTVLLNAMVELAPDKSWDWDFVINLSESDFPVKTDDELVDFLTAYKDRNFVKSHGREVQRFIQKQGLDKTFVECDNHMWRIGDRSLPTGIVIDGGSDWFALSRPFVEYLGSHEKNSLLRGLITVFKYTLLPAESFFHTALRNSPFCRTYVDNNLHVTNWRRRLGCKCQYKHIVDWCGCSPNNFRLEDWGRLQGTKSKPVFFARKFEPLIDQSIINQVEAWLYGPIPSNVTGLESYWQSVYSSSDIGPRPDDAILTIGLSIARINARRRLNCSLSSSEKILEISSYYRYDSYVGSLIMNEVTAKSSNSQPMVLETWVRPLDHFTVVETIPALASLKRVEVSSDYDQKESTARNWLRALGPFSEPVAVYHLDQNMPGPNLTLLWLDPLGNLADVSHLSIVADSLTGFVKSSLKTPMFPGIWTLRILYGGKTHSETTFLVTPLELLNGSPLTQRESGFVHRGPAERYPKRTEDYGIRGGGSALERRALANARRTGKDLHQWIDSLTARFYEVLENCVTSKVKWCGLPACEKTDWSSLAPDPKSEIKPIDEKTGRMRRW